jgi:tetratricopeptide (TPR) repeat protein
VGKFQITDNSSYFRAKEAYKNSPEPFEIVFWRGRQQMTATVSSSTLGIYFNEYNPVIYKFDSLVARVNAMQEIPEYQREVEFAGAFAQPAEKSLDEARALVDRAEADGTMSPTQILVARMYLIFDDAPPEELKKLSELLAKFIETEPEGHVYYVGQTRFFENKRYRAAVGCFKRYLEVEPDDVSARLNLGFAAYHLGLWDEAESAADYVLKNPHSVSEYGLLVAYQVKAMGALGHRDYGKSILFAEKAFELNPKSFDIALVQLAAAQSGDLQKLHEASMKFQQVLPDRYQVLQFQMDAVEAYALARDNQLQPARDLVLKWKSKDRVLGRIKAYWEIYPGGDEVLKNWKALMQ